MGVLLDQLLPGGLTLDDVVAFTRHTFQEPDKIKTAQDQVEQWGLPRLVALAAHEAGFRVPASAVSTLALIHGNEMFRDYLVLDIQDLPPSVKGLRTQADAARNSMTKYLAAWPSKAQENYPDDVKSITHGAKLLKDGEADLEERRRIVGDERLPARDRLKELDHIAVFLTNQLETENGVYQKRYKLAQRTDFSFGRKRDSVSGTMDSYHEAYQPVLAEHLKENIYPVLADRSRSIMKVIGNNRAPTKLTELASLYVNAASQLNLGPLSPDSLRERVAEDIVNQRSDLLELIEKSVPTPGKEDEDMDAQLYQPELTWHWEQFVLEDFVTEHYKQRSKEEPEFEFPDPASNGKRTPSLDVIFNQQLRKLERYYIGPQIDTNTAFVLGDVLWNLSDKSEYSLDEVLSFTAHKTNGEQTHPSHRMTETIRKAREILLSYIHNRDAEELSAHLFAVIRELNSPHNETAQHLPTYGGSTMSEEDKRKNDQEGQEGPVPDYIQPLELPDMDSALGEAVPLPVDGPGAPPEASGFGGVPGMGTDELPMRSSEFDAELRDESDDGYNPIGAPAPADPAATDVDLMTAEKVTETGPEMTENQLILHALRDGHNIAFEGTEEEQLEQFEIQKGGLERTILFQASSIAPVAKDFAPSEEVFQAIYNTGFAGESEGDSLRSYLLADGETKAHLLSARVNDYAEAAKPLFKAAAGVAEDSDGANYIASHADDLVGALITDGTKVLSAGQAIGYSAKAVEALATSDGEFWESYLTVLSGEENEAAQAIVEQRARQRMIVNVMSKMGVGDADELYETIKNKGEEKRLIANTLSNLATLYNKDKKEEDHIVLNEAFEDKFVARADDILMQNAREALYSFDVGQGNRTASFLKGLKDDLVAIVQDDAEAVADHAHERVDEPAHSGATDATTTKDVEQSLAENSGEKPADFTAEDLEKYGALTRAVVQTIDTKFDGVESMLNTLGSRLTRIEEQGPGKRPGFFGRVYQGLAALALVGVVGYGILTGVKGSFTEAGRTIDEAAGHTSTPISYDGGSNSPQLDERIAALQETVAGLQTSVAGLPQETPVIPNYENQLEALSGNFSELQRELSNLQRGVSGAASQDQVSELGSNLDVVDERIRGIVNSYERLQATLTRIEGTDGSPSPLVAGVQGTLDELQARMAELSQTLDGVAERMAAPQENPVLDEPFGESYRALAAQMRALHPTMDADAFNDMVWKDTRDARDAYRLQLDGADAAYRANMSFRYLGNHLWDGAVAQLGEDSTTAERMAAIEPGVQAGLRYLSELVGDDMHFTLAVDGEAIGEGFTLRDMVEGNNGLPGLERGGSGYTNLVREAVSEYHNSLNIQGTNPTMRPTRGVTARNRTAPVSDALESGFAGVAELNDEQDYVVTPRSD